MIDWLLVSVRAGQAILYTAAALAIIAALAFCYRLGGPDE